MRPITRSLSPEKIGEVSAAFAFALLDGDHDPDAALASWAAIGAMMPLARDLVRSSIDRRGPLGREMRDKILEMMESAR